MKLIFLFLIIVPIISSYSQVEEEQEQEFANQALYDFLLSKRDLGSKSPLKFFGKCISDSECKPNEYCEHSGINPFGSCKIGKENKQSCVFDRHCRSKICHHLKCTSKKPVKDGVCSKDQHEECIAEQYCHHVKKEEYKCINRKCSGLCIKDAHCLSKNCSLLHCKKPEKGCQTWNN